MNRLAFSLQACSENYILTLRFLKSFYGAVNQVCVNVAGLFTVTKTIKLQITAGIFTQPLLWGRRNEKWCVSCVAVY